MKGAAFACVALLALIGSAAVPAMAGEVEVTDKDRVFRNFTREAAVLGEGRFRLEVRGFTLDDEEEPELDLSGFPLGEVAERVNAANNGQTAFEPNRVQGEIIDLLGSYGVGANAEIGFDVPFLIQKTRLVDATSSDVDTRNDQDVGDVLLYGKFKRMVAKNCALAAGVELNLPTGVERKGFGTGEFGANPFLSSRYQQGRWGVGAHIGYQIYTGSVDDAFNYSAEALVRGNEHYALRTEIAGRYFRALGQQFNDIVVMPGFDLYLSDNFTIRPTGLAGLTDEALDWGIGVGIALTR